jgi:hypothetical protein
MVDSAPQPVQLTPAASKATKQLAADRNNANSAESSMQTVEHLEPRSPRKLIDDDDELSSHESPSTMPPPPRMKTRQRFRHFNGMLVFFMLSVRAPC